MASTTETTATRLPPATTQDDTSLWTPPQESALLQSLLHYKPVGLHKHFCMIAIRDQLLTTGLIHPEEPHTSIAGIWRKLGTLYDLEGLDEREDSVIGGAKEKSADDNEYWREFELPREDFEELMWQKRFAPDGSVLGGGSSRVQSPATVTGTVGRRESTIADTDEPRSSPVSVSSVRTPSGRAGRGRTGRGGGGRLSRLQNEIETESGKGSRRGSKAASVVGREDSVVEDVADEEGEEESGDEDEEESEEQDDDGEEAGTKRGSTAKRGRGGKRSRGSRRGRRR